MKKEIYNSDYNTNITSGAEQKYVALSYILEAWGEAVHDGIDARSLSTSAIFVALSHMISVYGEESVARMTDGLAKRVRHGEFTVDKTIN